VSYIDPDLIGDETTVAEAILAAVADQIDGWEAHEGSVETSLAEAFGVALATAITTLKDEAATAYGAMGELVLGVTRDAPEAATVRATWTRTPGVLGDVSVPAGTEVTATTSDGLEVVFAVVDDYALAAGIDTLPDVELVAVEPGPGSNDASGDARQEELVQFAQTVTLQGLSTGGTDEEDLTAWLDRLRDRGTRMRALPITPEDYAAMATDTAGVARAFAVNRYNPATPATPTNGHLGLFAVGADGLALPSTVATALTADVTGIDRPLNVAVHVLAPAYVDVTVTITVVAEPTADTVALSAAVVAAVRALIDPATWEADARAPGGWAAEPTTTLSAYRVAQAAAAVDGVRQVTAVSLNGTANGSVALPTPLSVPRIAAGAGVTVTVA
jgi:hypothetical protein